MTTELTDAHRAKFLRDPEHCPFCGGAEVTTEMLLNTAKDKATRTTIFVPAFVDKFARRIATRDTCGKCGARWQETYHLIDIEPWTQ